MKAEHRKELQTNALADRMGRVIQRMKGRPSKNTVLTVFLVIILVLAAVFFFATRSGSRTTQSRLWTEVAGGHLADYQEILKGRYANANQGKAVRFDLAWLKLWELGIKNIPENASRALDTIKEAKGDYQKLAEECKDDPVWGPEALYNIAVAEETLALRDPEKHLDEALAAYKKVTERFQNSAHAQQATKRAEELNDGDKRRRIRDFYVELANEPRIRIALNLKWKD